MTAVEAVQNKRDIESLYVDRRGALYRALVLITDDRDLSVEAIDRAFAKCAGRWRAIDPTLAEQTVLGTAVKWVGKRAAGRNPELRGFRLPATDPAVHDAAEAVAFRSLDVDDRAAIVGRHFLGWSAPQLGVLTGRDAEDAAALVEAAEARLRNAGGTSLEAVAEMLAAEAAALREPLSRLESTRTKGRLRKLATALAAVAGLSVFVGGSLVAVGALGSNDEPEPVGQAVPASDTPGVSSVPQGTTALGDFTWTQVPLPIREGDVSGVAHGPNGFIVLANDYSARGPAAVIYQSEDGVEWEQLGAPPVGNSGWVQSVQYIGGQYVAIGSEVNELVGRDTPKIWVSSDGLGWTESVLPVESEIDVQGQRVPVYTYLQNVTGSEGDLVVIGGQHAEIDPERLLREFLPEGVSARGGWGTSPNGIELYDNNGNVTFRGTWEELGVPDELVGLLSGSATLMWVSEDGIEWEQSEIDIDIGFDGGVGNIASAGGLRAAQVWAQFGSQIWIERDGEWERARVPGAGSTSTVVGAGDRILIAGSDEAGAPAIWTTSDGATWDRATGDIPSQVNAFYPADGGVVLAMAQGFAGNNIGPAELQVDGLTVQARQDGSFRVLDDGEEVLIAFAEDAIRGDDGSMTLIDESGDPVVTFNEGDVQRAWEEVFRSFEAEVEPAGPPPIELLASVDGGRTWRNLDFGEAVGGGFFPTGAAWSGTTVVLAGFSEEFGFREGPPPVVVWVGTSDS